MNRRNFLIGSLPLAVGSADPVTSANGPVPRVCLVVREEKRPLDITAIFDELGIAWDLVTPAEAEDADARRFSILWIACPEYPFHKQLSNRLVARIDSFLEAGHGVFAEFTLNFPGAPALATPQKSGVARLFVSSALDAGLNHLQAGTILDEHDSICLPLTGEGLALRRVLSFGEVKGVQRVIETPAPNHVWPGLVWGERGEGRFAVATTSICEYRRREYAPAVHWRQFLMDLTRALLPAKDRAAVQASYIPLRAYTEPRVWVLPGSEHKLVIETRAGAVVALAGDASQSRAGASGRVEIPLTSGAAATTEVKGTCSLAGSRRAFRVPLRIADRRTVYRRALDRNIRWFERSGALLRPDGALGVSEWISEPDINGNRIPYGKGQMFSPERADCVFESGLAFSLYGKLARTERYRRVGENLLLSILDFQRLGRDDTRYGLWNTRGRTGPLYQDDVAWSTIGCFAGHRYTTLPILLHRGLLSAKASVQAFQTRGKNGLVLAGAQDDPYPHPHDRGQLLASWLYAYGSTGDQSYLELALPLVREMIERFSTIPRFLISRSGEATRFLLPLTLAYAYTKHPLFAEALRKQTDYLVSRLAPCGAIREDGSNTGSKVSGNDLGLTYDANETISDQLYTTSFASMNLWMAYKATSDKVYLDVFHRVMDYLVRIQVEDESKPTIDGGWMRGFDYSLWEYYGSNADSSWTAYCMETGWTNAIIDIALALYLTDDTFYPSRPPVDWKA